MEYTELKIVVLNDEQAEILTALLADYPFESFCEEESLLSAYIPSEEYDACRQAVEQMLSSFGVAWREQRIEQQNWNSEWESSFEAVNVEGSRPIRIRASHHTPPEEGVVDVVIAPRMSFGTGHHTTTALMSRTIAELGFVGQRGLDMGCGTGVLAIVAVKCGARKMLAVDIDEWACDSARESIALSGVDDCVEVRCGSMAVVADDEKFDFVLANINRNILIDMMPSFARVLGQGGRLLMSGFLVEDIDVLQSAAAEFGFGVERTAERDGWVVMVCSKR